MRLAVRGYVAGIGAFLVCPCHLPLTLPIILALTAGTAVGGWLADNSLIIYAISFSLFLIGLVLAGRWLLVDGAAVCEVDLKQKQPTESSWVIPQTAAALASEKETK